jgi:hypothetical protein
MERMFSPCTQMQDMSESQGHHEELRGDPELLQELEELRGNPELLPELDLDVSTEELLSAIRSLTYADLFAILANHMRFCG